MNLAETFVSLLDSRRYDEAAQLIDKDCVYQDRQSSHQGRPGVIAMYRELDAEMRKLFDDISYDSRVEILDGEHCIVHFADTLRKGDRTHTVRSQQMLTFREGKIVDIEQQDMPGEAEELRRFYQQTSGEARR